MTWLRWQISLAAWWLWLKVTPESPFKADIVDAVCALRRLYPKKEQPQLPMTLHKRMWTQPLIGTHHGGAGDPYWRNPSPLTAKPPSVSKS